MNYVIATSRTWHEPMAERLKEKCGMPFHLITRKKDLTPERLMELAPRYVFFPHWSHIIPADIHNRFECVIFHMTDVPFGRGGSPLQNLIVRGITDTKVTALRCAEQVDAGPVYMKRPLPLHGTAEEIYLRAGRVVEEMIEEIVHTEPSPHPQVGKAVTFRRRRPEESDMCDISDISKLYDHIRMLDADGYPRAFLRSGRFRLEFSRAVPKDGRLVADVAITEVSDE
ncbi:MAG: methionyl-tRNA formyltransferase [candidate division Zixibacteria bacterium]|nr:methionyl-tRNA formyltransferase [candidate division Zixibacteria bacterium]MDH3938046.1 methionyl-tRNA formyltransferase [candidate division Zixibacteria bacterium]MDH4033935.1 methionyl-tRNA formyltransferase [candidate division Zixibacteria bacterium]